MTDIKKQILVIDDDPDITRMLQLILEYHGFEIKRAHGTAQGMQMLATMVPDMVLIDYMMPHFTGLELCTYVRRDPRVSHVPIIVYSALNTADAIDASMKAGATRFVQKTVGNDALVGVIREVLASG
jgi:DNA-binding response OmpR family regulator